MRADVDGGQKEEVDDSLEVDGGQQPGGDRARRPGRRRAAAIARGDPAAIARGVLAGGDPRELLLGSIQSQVHVHVRIIKGSLVLSCACRWKRNLKINEMEKIVRETSCQRFGW